MALHYEEVEILTGADEAGGDVVRVQYNKTGGTHQVWDDEIVSSEGEMRNISHLEEI